jgi:hypothetical protein
MSCHSPLLGAVGSGLAKQLIRIEKRQKKGQIHDVNGENRVPKGVFKKTKWTSFVM